MAMRIPESILDDILGRVDVVEVIASYIPLKKAGRNFKANCPFHHEKTASFIVSPVRQIYHCFGCGEAGNAFKFLMRHERMEFLEAVEVLAKKAGVILPEQEKPEIARAASLSTQLYKINELALGFYENNLHTPGGKAAYAYLEKRGIAQKTIKEFRLGLAGSSWDGLINFLRSKNISLSLIEKAGLILPKDNGGYYDRFRSRVIFPIFDIRGRGIGFGARVLDNSLPKYINSPETAIYTKGKNLFGLHLSKDYIRDADSAVIVEGYLDFIVPYQEGIKNIVASQGTALTLEQIRLLKRYTHNVVMVYDGDTAGEMATLRSLDMLIEEGMVVKIAPLPKGMDPDTQVRKNGIASLQDIIVNSSNLFDYKLDILKSRHDIKDAHGKSKIAAQMLSTIYRFDDAILRAEYVKKLAAEIEIAERYILEELNKIKPNIPAASSAPLGTAAVPVKNNSFINPAEKLLIKFMLEENELIEKIMQELEPDDFQDMRTTRIVSLMQDLATKGKAVAPNILMNYFDEDDAGKLLGESMFMPEVSERDREKALHDCIQRIKCQRSKKRRENLQIQIKKAQSSGDKQRLGSLIQEFHNLIKKGD